jgi:hypothetical protein
MKTKYLALSLAVALAALAGCSRSEPPKPAAKKSVAETFSSPAQGAPAPSEPAIARVPAEMNPVSPDQIPNVGTAPAGQVAFGPSTPNSGMDPAGDAERARMIADRDAAMAARNPPPQPPATTKKSHQ